MRLYKFIGFDSKYGISNSIELIEDNKIWISSFDKLNDPFEFRFHHQKEKPDFFSVLQSSRKGVLSLSSVNNDLLLWSHYGTSHRGVCFELETDSDDTLKTACEIKYEEKMPLWDQNNPDNALLTKAEAWKYESEYRVLVPNIVDTKISLNARSIQNIYFGVNITYDDIKKIYPLCKSRNINCYQAETINENYSIQFKQIHNMTDFSAVIKKAALQLIIEKSFHKTRKLRFIEKLLCRK